MSRKLAEQLWRSPSAGYERTTRPNVAAAARSGVELPIHAEADKVYVRAAISHLIEIDEVKRNVRLAGYLSAFTELPQLHALMRATPGSCDWWRCHNYRYNFTFLNNAEAYLGFHLRRTGLGCRELQAAAPPVQMTLPSTRRRDWGDWRDRGPGEK